MCIMFNINRYAIFYAQGFMKQKFLLEYYDEASTFGPANRRTVGVDKTSLLYLNSLISDSFNIGN